MPRARLGKLTDEERLRYLVEHHIVAFRIGMVGGSPVKQITQVEHASLGWMPPSKYYALQKLHDAMPLIGKVIEGGYRTKEALWSMSAQITLLGSSLSLPFGLIFPLIETIALSDAVQAGNAENIAYWLFALAGPFGDALAIKAVIDSVGKFKEDVYDRVAHPIILPPKYIKL